jgi:hypothetical protein
VARSFAIAVFGLLIAACSAPSASDARVEQVRSGALAADYIYFFDGDTRSEHGTQRLDAAGAFRPDGSAIVCVFRTIPPEAVAYLKREKIKAAEHTAYLLPAGAIADADGMRSMVAIGPVDPAASAPEIAKSFGFEIVNP